jgi:urease accessory protein
LLQGASKLRFTFNGTQTVLAASHTELPLQIQRPRVGPHGEAIVTLLTPAGALFGGDAVSLDVAVQSGASVVLRTASATQLHRATDRGSTFDLTMTIAAGATLRYAPFELIPFAGADYRQTIRVNLAAGAEATLTEVVTPGRLWEHFQYLHLELVTEVYLDGTLIALDAQRIVPTEMDCVTAVGGRTHFGTLLHVGPNSGAPEADRLHARFADRGLCGSASVLPTYGIAARALGSSAQGLLAALEAVEH